MNKEKLMKLLEKFFTKSLSREEENELSQWYESFESEGVWLSTLTDAEKFHLREKIKAEMLKQALSPILADKTVSIKNPLNTPILVQVLVVVIFTMVFLLNFHFPKKRTYETTYGEVKTFLLPDSSKVTLSANSSLIFRWMPGKSFDRQIEIVGEAYLSVYPDKKNRPFVINQGEAFQVEVLGTEFNFKNRPQNKSVVLQSGRVNVLTKSDSKALKLEPGDWAILDGEKRCFTVSKPDNLESHFAWKERKLILDKMSVKEVLTKIVDYYLLPIELAKVPEGGKMISGTLPLTEDSQALLSNIEQLFEIQIKNYHH